MRRVILAGTVATSLVTGAAAGLLLGVPITAHSGERLASTTPRVSIAAAATAAAAAAVPATTAAVQTGVAAPAAAPAIASAIAPAAASILHAKVSASPTGSTPTSVNSKVAANAGTAGTAGELAVVASALHMALADLKSALADGESLAQIATSAGVDPSKLIAAVVNDATSKINTAVTLGKLSRAQADKIIAMLPGLVTDVVNHSFRHIDEEFGAGSKLPMSLGSLGELASLGNFAKLGDLGNLPDLDKLADLGNMANLPKLGDLGDAGNFGSFFTKMFGSFGQFDNVSAGAGTQAGTAANVDPQTLISDLVSMATAAVNAAVSAGLLTPTQANTILSSLKPTITELVHKLLDAGLNFGNQASAWASFATSWMGHDH
jgi:urease accessory protein UreF